MRAMIAAAGILTGLCCQTQAADLVVLSGQGATPGVRAVAAAFAEKSGHKVTVLQEAGASLDQKVNNGPADVIANSPEPMDGFAKNGKLVEGSLTPWVMADLGVSVRAGAPKPDISTVEAYKATLIAA